MTDAEELARYDGEKFPWLGVPTHRLPTDLFALADALRAIKPKMLVTDVERGHRGLALFAATVMDVLSQGQVYAVGLAKDKASQHRRVRPVTFIENVTDDLKRAGSVVVVLQRKDAQSTAGRLEFYSRSLPPRSLVLVEDTAPEVLAGLIDGGGPYQGVLRFLRATPGWAIVRDFEPPLTRNPGGWLAPPAEGE